MFSVASLDTYCPWKRSIFDEEEAAAADQECDGVSEKGSIVYMLYPGAGGNWRIQVRIIPERKKREERDRKEGTKKEERRKKDRRKESK